MTRLGFGGGEVRENFLITPVALAARAGLQRMLSVSVLALATSFGRRAVLKQAGSASFAFAALPVAAFNVNDGSSKKPLVTSDALENVLPRGAVIAFQRQWPAVQLGADTYTFVLRERVRSPQQWDLVGSFLGLGGDGSGSRLERELINPMTILSLSFPPDAGGDEMAEAITEFRKAMGLLGKAAPSSPGVTVGPSSAEVALAVRRWDEGRQALNRFYAALNAATETNRIVLIPAEASAYPRSKERFVQLNKDAALCRNRGGEALAGLWGQLMVYGTVPGVNPCGDVTLATYFEQ